MRFELVLAAALAFATSAAVAQTETAPAATGPESFPEVVASVNGTEITKSALLRRAEAIRAQLPQGVGPDFYERVLDDMVGAELLYQSGASKGHQPTDEEIDAELAAQAERYGGQETFSEALESEGLSVEEVRGELEKEIVIQSLIEEEFIPNVTVSEEQKRLFYQENSAEMQRPGQFRVAHILIGVDEDATPEEKEAARKKAAALRSMVEAGQDLADLARRNSDDPGSKDNGGELPWLSQGQTVPPFEAAVQALSPGELSDVVETQYGYHVIRLLEKREAGTMPYEEIEERIGEFLKRRNLQEAIQGELDVLRESGNVEIFI